MGDGAAHLAGLVPDLEGALEFRVLLGGEADPGHGTDSLDGVGADRGLLRQHDGVGAVPDRVGHVRSLRPRRPVGGHHRFQHLGRGDDRDAGPVGAVDDLLLHRGQLPELQLHAEVAARDHHRVRHLEDLAEVADRPRTRRWKVPSTAPVRIFGPCRSPNRATGRPTAAAASRTLAAASRWAPASPWEKLRRATSMPAWIIALSICGEELDGPIVQTMRVRRGWVTGTA